MLPPWQNSLTMRAARREPVERTPIWLMRQAGRYMAEYRAIRRETTFLELCKNPRLCAEIMLTAVERLRVDAAILFSDLLVILEPLGLELEFAAGEGPVIHNPVRRAEDLSRLRELENMDRLAFVPEAVRQTRAGLRDDLPLIGFAGAPFTLAAYAVEGGSSRDYRFTKSLMYADRGAWNALTDRLARAATVYLNAQIAAGAQMVQIFDSWAGCLGVEDFCEFALPATRRLVAALPAETPVIYFSTGNPAFLPHLREIGGGRKNMVFGVDWRIPLDDAWRILGEDAAVQGNLDPAVLLGAPDDIRRRAAAVLRQAGGRPGHIFNLGHGVLPQTPVENAVALVEAVRETSARRMDA
ncbi:MAG: uroporphyrinogen decarboxylase [Pirellulales bacterium]|nr:uroporphyrinogen decarboxylase [Pirellulales bacterium]